jgi:predicted Rossmann fold nucleotide-binding protein DprA/Smf involved in DNA uptake
MNSTISPNTQAILLLTAPLIAGRNPSSPDLLTPGEYKRLARHLREIQRQPADLVSPDAGELLRDCQSIIDEARLRRLLERGFLLSQVMERWRVRAIWVISRADAEYPRRLKARLREDAPAILYGCGDIGLLEGGGLAVEGSRHVNGALIDYAGSIGRLAALAGKALVSGGARGTDQAAMRGALEAGGQARGVLADSLEKATMNREYRNSLLAGKLTLISPYDPGAGFNVGNAMQRNKLIYALADVSLVVNSDVGKGGTWTGAVEQLDKLKFVPVYVRSTGEPSIGLDALRKKGALDWPNPNDTNSFNAIFNTPHLPSIASEQMEFALGADGDKHAEKKSLAPVSPESAAVSCVNDVSTVETPSRSVHQAAEVSPAEMLFTAARDSILRILTVPKKDATVAAALEVSTAQAKTWLQRLVDEGVLEKQKKPAGYVVKQDRLFE